jgi:hypothetical protein
MVSFLVRFALNPFAVQKQFQKTAEPKAPLF